MLIPVLYLCTHVVCVRDNGGIRDRLKTIFANRNLPSFWFRVTLCDLLASDYLSHIRRMRHQQAKEVVLGLRESLEEKNKIIKELKDQSSEQDNSASDASEKKTTVRTFQPPFFTFPFLTFC